MKIEELSKEQLSKYIETIQQGNDIYFRDNVSGHSFNLTKKLNDFLFEGDGFCRDIRQGDVVYLMNNKTEEFEPFLTLTVKYDRDPKDRFKALLVGITSESAAEERQ